MQHAVQILLLLRRGRETGTGVLRDDDGDDAAKYNKEDVRNHNEEILPVLNNFLKENDIDEFYAHSIKCHHKFIIIKTCKYIFSSGGLS